MKIPEGKKVLFLGRYKDDVWALDSTRIKCESTLSGVKIVFNPRPKLKMEYMTIHGSKGLEADFVFLLNNKKGSFPSIRNEPILIPLLLECNNAQIWEERRLFYVAITRARDTAYVLGVNNSLSQFFLEMFPESVNKSIIRPKDSFLLEDDLLLAEDDYLDDH